MALVGGSPLPGEAHIGELVLEVVGPCPHPMPCNADGPASAAFGDGERRGSGELPEDNSSSAGRSTSSGAATSLPLPGREGGNGFGRFPRLPGPAGFQLGSQALIFFLQPVCLFA